MTPMCNWVDKRAIAKLNLIDYRKSMNIYVPSLLLEFLTVYEAGGTSLTKQWVKSSTEPRGPKGRQPIPLRFGFISEATHLWSEFS